MDLTQISLAEFLGDDDQEYSPAAILPRDCLVDLGSGLELQILKSFGDYSIVLLNNLGDVGAVDKEGNEAGYYSGNSLIVHEEHRGKGLAIALVLYAYEHREEIPQSRSLTDGGRNALKAAWEVANSQRSSAWWP